MLKQDANEQRVQQDLRRGYNKKDILARLSKENDRDDILFFLNNLPDEHKRRKYLWVNRLLCLLLLVLTIKKIYAMAILQLAALSVDQFSPLLLLDLIVPIINFYILSKIIRFHRQGYQFMAVLGILALLRPENRIMPDLAMYMLILGMSVFLLRQLFPKQERIEG